MLPFVAAARGVAQPPTQKLNEIELTDLSAGKGAPSRIPTPAGSGGLRSDGGIEEEARLSEKQAPQKDFSQLHRVKNSSDISMQKSAKVHRECTPPNNLQATGETNVATACQRKNLSTKIPSNYPQAADESNGATPTKKGSAPKFLEVICKLRRRNTMRR